MVYYVCLQPQIKRHLLLGRKAMTNLDNILKSRDVTLPTEVCIVKAKVFPVVMYECESWAIKKAECQRIWCFRAVLLEKTLEHPLYSKEIKPVNLKEISPENSLKGLRLKLPSFGHLMPLEEELTHWKRPWCWGRLRVGGEEGNRRWDGWMV